MQPAPAIAAPRRRWRQRLFRPLYLAFFLALSLYLLWKSLTPVLPSRNAPLHLYSNQSQQDLTLTFLEAIRNAQKSIDLAMFGLSDPAILKELERRAKQGIKTRVYYDVTGSPSLRAHLAHCELHPILQTGLMHQKILLIDEEMVFLGSANMTTHSLQMHDNLVLGLSSKKLAAFLKEKIAKEPGHFRSLIGGQEVELWLLPDHKGLALNELRSKLQNAKHSIRAALFTFTHPALIQELLAAHKRGVHVSLVIDMHSSLGASRKAVELLRKGGVPLFYSQGSQLLHHKFVYIDEKMLITGSANWTKAAFAKNSDTLCILHSITPQQKKFLNALWATIATRAKKKS